MKMDAVENDGTLLVFTGSAELTIKSCALNCSGCSHCRLAARKYAATAGSP